MTENEDDLHQLIREMDVNSTDSINRVIARLSPYILRTIRRRLHQSMRSKFDTADFSQLVWLSFFNNFTTIKQLSVPEQMIKYVLRIAESKVTTEIQRHTKTAKRDVRREVRLPEESRSHEATASKVNTPSQKFIARELLSQLQENLSVRDQEILSFKILGHNQNQIAEKLDISERTVRRVIDRIEKEMQRNA